mgnify:FL=1
MRDMGSPLTLLEQFYRSNGFTTDLHLMSTMQSEEIFGDICSDNVKYGALKVFAWRYGNPTAWWVRISPPRPDLH